MKFKLPEGNPDEIKATIEGSFINSEFNTQLVGLFKIEEKYANIVKLRVYPFTILKQTHAILTFYQQDVLHRFDVVIFGGLINDRQNRVSL